MQDTMRPDSTSTTNNDHQRYYVLVALASIVACTFHTSVYRRYSTMQDLQRQASAIKFSIEGQELETMELHSEVSGWYKQSINHTLQAFELAHDANVLKQQIVNETRDVDKLQAQVVQDEEEAARDNVEANLWAVRNYGDNLASMGSSTTAHQLAKVAELEHDMATQHMRMSQIKHDEGTVKLRQAQEQVRVAQEHDDVEENAQASFGICRLFPYACNMVSSRTDNESAAASMSASEWSGDSSTGSRTSSPSDESIRASRAVQAAIKELNEAMVERDLAMELFHNASMHANASSQFLHEAQLFDDQAEYDKAESIAYRDEADEEMSEATTDKELLQEEQQTIIMQSTLVNKYANESRSVLHLAITENHQATTTAMTIDRKLDEIRSLERLWNAKTVEAYHHISKAGWYALVSIVAAIGVLVLVTVHIIGAFRYARPLTWIVRCDSPSNQVHDILYLINHMFIMVLTMGFVGELLYYFRQETTTAKVAITLLFGFVAAVFQVTLLHFVPHIFRLVGRSDFGSWNVRVLLYEDIVKKGLVVFLLCAMEVLLLWIVAGTVVFQHAYKWDNWGVWIGVFALAASYSIYLRKHDCINPQYHQVDTSGYLDVFDNACTASNDATRAQEEEEEEAKEERQALISTSDNGVVSSSSGAIVNSIGASSSNVGSVSRSSNGSIANQSTPPSSSTYPSMKSVPLGTDDDRFSSTSTAAAGIGGYGTLVGTTDEDRYRHFLNEYPHIHSTFISSWRVELEKLRLVMEILLACWSIWVVWNSVNLIVKLSPLASEVTWGRCPLWILNIFLLAILICFGIWYTSQRRK